jgi:exopolyphosphatase/guanosine-5'-triphosphate,3'-diphosphate pyrophosphatase
VIQIPEAPGTAPERLVITGGNADALADVADPANAPYGVSHLTPDDLARVENALRPLPVAERIARYSLRPDRADVIVIAAIIFRHLAERTRLDRLIAPRVGVQHGLIAELLASH